MESQEDEDLVIVKEIRYSCPIKNLDQKKLIRCRHCNKGGHESQDCQQKVEEHSKMCSVCLKRGHYEFDCKRKNLLCHSCNGFGHMAVQCRSFQSSEPRASDNPTWGSVFSSHDFSQKEINEKLVRCMNCFEIGHDSCQLITKENSLRLNIDGLIYTDFKIIRSFAMQLLQLNYNQFPQRFNLYKAKTSISIKQETIAINQEEECFISDELLKSNM